MVIRLFHSLLTIKVSISAGIVIYIDVLSVCEVWAFIIGILDYCMELQTNFYVVWVLRV